ncbi:MAG: acyltransferase domain-containing protein [Desulfobacterales bacterium]|jgi:[acyl-carrier-protein] S-malonyltransferase|nr:acyltransferase domain-containing protein [Desulfobacterales bacterium]
MGDLSKKPTSALFLFPGQGAQHVGMGKELYGAFAAARDIYDQADSLLGFPLSRLCFKGPEAELFQDINAQLAVYTTSCAIADVLRAAHILPSIVTGYSSGFYAAAYAAGSFDFKTGLKIVRSAGENLLEEGGKTDGAMAAIFGLSREKVAEICRQTGNVVIAIANTAHQIVISGLRSAIASVIETCRAKDALDAYFLPAQTAYHSPFVADSCERFLNEIPDDFFRAATVPIFSYSFLRKVQAPLDIKTCMARQLSQSVLWVDLIKTLRDNGPGHWIEVGPGTMLSRSVRWTDRAIDILHTARVKDIVSVIERMANN